MSEPQMTADYADVADKDKSYLRYPFISDINGSDFFICGQSAVQTVVDIRVAEGKNNEQNPKIDWDG